MQNEYQLALQEYVHSYIELHFCSLNIDKLYKKRVEKAIKVFNKATFKLVEKKEHAGMIPEAPDLAGMLLYENDIMKVNYYGLTTMGLEKSRTEHKEKEEAYKYAFFYLERKKGILL